MKSYTFVALIILLMLAALGQVSSERVAASQNSIGQKWEYKVALSSSKDFNQPQGPNSGYDSFQHWVEDLSGLNGWGEQGWELVSVVRNSSSETDRNLIFYFKRQKK